MMFDIAFTMAPLNLKIVEYWWCLVNAHRFAQIWYKTSTTHDILLFDMKFMFYIYKQYFEWVWRVGDVLLIYAIKSLVLEFCQYIFPIPFQKIKYIITKTSTTPIYLPIPKIILYITQFDMKFMYVECVLVLIFIVKLDCTF